MPLLLNGFAASTLSSYPLISCCGPRIEAILDCGSCIIQVDLSTGVQAYYILGFTYTTLSNFLLLVFIAVHTNPLLPISAINGFRDVACAKNMTGHVPVTGT